MLVAVDFDGTIVREDHRYDDLQTPLVLVDGARDALEALKRARHHMLVYSGRSSRALLYDPRLDPWVRAGVVPEPPRDAWAKSRELNIARYKQMVAFVGLELPGLFDAIDDGTCGKVHADLYIDNRSLRLGRGSMGGLDWHQIAVMFGDADGPSPFASER